MNEPQPILFRKKRLRVFRGRGKLYSWLRTHRAKIAVGLSSGEYTWAMLCAECSRHGVLGREGAPATRKAAWKAWQTLCRDLEAIGETPMEKKPPRTYPSRFPKDWKPEAFREGAPVRAAPSNPESYDWRRRLVQLRQTINERSGRKE